MSCVDIPNRHFDDYFVGFMPNSSQPHPVVVGISAEREVLLETSLLWLIEPQKNWVMRPTSFASVLFGS